MDRLKSHIELIYREKFLWDYGCKLDVGQILGTETESLIVLKVEIWKKLKFSELF